MKTKKSSLSRRCEKRYFSSKGTLTTSSSDSETDERTTADEKSSKDDKGK